MIFSLAPKDYGIGNKFSLDCKRTDPSKTLLVTINTSVDGQTIGPFELPSSRYFALENRVRVLSEELNAATRRQNQQP